MRAISIVSVIALVAASCVPAKQYNELKAEQEKCEKERQDLTSNNRTISAENDELKADLATLTKKFEQLKADNHYHIDIPDGDTSEDISFEGISFTRETTTAAFAFGHVLRHRRHPGPNRLRRPGIFPQQRASCGQSRRRRKAEAGRKFCQDCGENNRVTTKDYPSGSAALSK